METPAWLVALRLWWKRRQNLGARGERWAAAHYRRAGATQLAMNWRAGADEIDLVMLEGKVLVFVEVKTRTAAFGGQGHAAVDARKRTALRRAARAWLREIGGAPHWRFDIVEVLVCIDGSVRILQHRGEPLFGPRRF
jgi:putative endonuclease